MAGIKDDAAIIAEIEKAVMLWTRDKDEYHIKMIIYRNMLEDERIETDHINEMSKDEARAHLVQMHIADMEVFEDAPHLAAIDTND